MAAVVTTPASHLSELATGLEALEVRSGPMILTVKEVSPGGVIVVATPAAGFELETRTEEQGVTWRSTIRARAS